jgi:Flp pilus assembly protein TadD
LLKKFEITDEPEDRRYSPEVQELLGQVGEAMQGKRLDQAEEICRRILEQDPGCGTAYSILAIICSIRGDKVETRRHLEKSLEIDPDYPLVRCNLALLYLDDGKVEEAEKLVVPLLERQKLTQSELIAYNVAMALIQLHRGNLGAVEKAAEFLLEVAPEDPLSQKLKTALEEHRKKG